jgi:hypothetical protein
VFILYCHAAKLVRMRTCDPAQVPSGDFDSGLIVFYFASSVIHSSIRQRAKTSAGGITIIFTLLRCTARSECKIEYLRCSYPSLDLSIYVKKSPIISLYYRLFQAVEVVRRRVPVQGSPALCTSWVAGQCYNPSCRSAPNNLNCF